MVGSRTLRRDVPGESLRRPERRTTAIAARLLLAILVGLAPIAAASGDAVLSADPPPVPGPDLRPFAGDWSRIDDTEAEALRLASIETAIADLSWLVRKMAGGVLRESAAPPPEVSFHWAGGRLVEAVAVEGRTEERPIALQADDAPEEAPPLEASPGSTPVSWRWRDGRLEALWRHAQARGRTRFLLDPASDLLHVEYEIQVTALDGIAPIRYASRFERVRSRQASAPSAAVAGARVSRAVNRSPEPIAAR